MIARIFELPPKAEALLQKTIDETPACVETIESVMEAVKTEEGLLYLIYEYTQIHGMMFAQIQGVMFAQFVEAERTYFNVALLGGEEIEKWKDELLAFVKHILKETDSKMIIVTRKGWKKIYPELQEIGSVFVL